MKLLRKNRFYLILFGVFLITFILRFYSLGSVPYGFYQDESAIGYNAYSILETGKDEYGKEFPLYFKSFGDYKLPIYIYLTTVSVFLFGLSEFAVRFPSALFGSLSVIFLFLFTRQLTKSNKISLVVSFLYAINPWSLHYNRATFEVSISLFLFVAGSYFLLRSLDLKKGFYFILAALFFVVSLYTYNLTRLLSPLLFSIILAFRVRDIKEVNRKYLYVSLIFSLILLLPFIVSFLSAGGVDSAKGTLIFSSSYVQAHQIELRSYVFENSGLVSKLFFNNYALSFIEFVKNVTRYIDFNFFFVSGSPHGNHGINYVGQFYLFEALTIIIGVISLARKRAKWFYLLLAWIGLVVGVASLTREAPHATRSFFLIPPLLIFSSCGIISIWEFLFSIRRSVIKIILGSLSLISAILSVVYYFSTYYFYFPSSYAQSWRSEDKAVSYYIKEIEKEYDKIIFDEKSGFIYSSLLFFNKLDPNLFQDDVIRLPDDSEGFSKVRSFGKYEFREVDWSKDLNTQERVLVVTSPNNVPSELGRKQEFKFPKRYIVSPIGQEIIQYPVEETAYVVVESQ